MTEDNLLRANIIQTEIRDLERDLGRIKQAWNSNKAVSVIVGGIDLQDKYSTNVMTYASNTLRI